MRRTWPWRSWESGTTDVPSRHFGAGGARQRLTGDEARTDVSQSQQIIRQVRMELEDVLRVLRR
jgi:hypothetical protein